MNFEQTVQYLYSKLPMFTRVGAAALKKDIDNTVLLCAALENPHEKFKTIHVGGTNGKGSTSHMLAAILQQAGYKTGLYTSPHLKDFRERIRVNGEMVSEEFVINFVENQKQNIETIQPSFFEVTVAMAFSYFEEQQVDIAIIEVGLGGRLDSTNIIQPELAVITNISLDHTNLLGNTYAEIAFEKAGIIKKETPIIIGERHNETDNVFVEKATAENAPLFFAEDHLKINLTNEDTEVLTVNVYQDEAVLIEGLKLDLTGIYQLKNIATVMQTVVQLRGLDFKITDEQLKQALQNVKELTGLKGRWYTISKDPLIICDTGHNKAGLTEVVKNIAKTQFNNLHFVVGMVKDKDINGVLALLPKNAQYYFCMPNLERALPADELQQAAEIHMLKGEIFNSVSDALKAAKNNYQNGDLIFIGGSTFVVAEAL